jgi:hypothetical protein
MKKRESRKIRRKCNVIVGIAVKCKGKIRKNKKGT